MQDGAPFPADATPTRVLMSLNPEYYGLMWRQEKNHEFRRRYPTWQPTQWFVYLTAPTARLSAVIDLAPAIVDTPADIGGVMIGYPGLDKLVIGGRGVHRVRALPAGSIRPLLQRG